MGNSTPVSAPAPASAIAPRYSSASLHRRFVGTAAIAGVIALLLLGGGAWWLLQRNIDQKGDETLGEAAYRSSLVLASAMAERARETDLLARMPEVVAAARDGTARANALGLPEASAESVDARFDAERSMLVAPGTRLLLRQMLPGLDARDALLTEAHGFNALITDRSGDFVQSDEAWWQEAWRDGRSVSDAGYDAASRSSVVSLSSAIRAGDEKVGVLKVKFDVTPLVASLASAGGGVRVDVLDAAGRILLSSDSTAMGKTLAGLPAGEMAGSVPLRVGDVDERAASRPANGGRWRVVAHVPESTIAAPFRDAKMAIVGATAVLLVVLLLLLLAMHRFLTRRISTPLGELAGVAEQVAAGNFAVAVRRADTDDEVGRLGRAVGAMILELRRLAVEIARSTRETNTMSAEITAGSEEMAATAGEIANTASDLSVQATNMAESIGSLAESAGSLRGLAGKLEAGAQEGVTRNGTLRALANENRAGLDASAESLGTLGNDVQASAMAIDSLAEASAEIRSFVALVRKLARQSKLLALNAAMEAARAGAQGEGFAVVAGEVRRLAAMSSDAAERTESVVNGVLGGIEASRASTLRAVEMADEVRASTARASASFAEIERAVEEADAWTAAVQHTSTAANELVADMTARLEQLSLGTESFAAAMEEVAASSEEQSAATQEIAGASGTMVAAANRLNELVAGLKLEGEAPATASPEARDATRGASASLTPAMA